MRTDVTATVPRSEGVNPVYVSARNDYALRAMPAVADLHPRPFIAPSSGSWTTNLADLLAPRATSIVRDKLRRLPGPGTTSPAPAPHLRVNGDPAIE